MINHKTFR